MSDIEIQPFDSSLAGEWDEFVSSSANGTFLHTRRFIGYHGDRFDDRSVVVRSGDRIVGCLPAALDPNDAARVVSHPGLSYGGLVRAPGFIGELVVESLRAVRDHYASDAAELVYKSTPALYHRRPVEDDSYAMFRLDAVRHRCDLAAAIRLTDAPRPNANRRRNQRRSAESGVEVSDDIDHLAEYWDVLTQRLADAHDAVPVHSLTQIVDLRRRFPDDIDLVTAVLDGSVVAGTVIFDSPQCTTAQYIASNPLGREVSALDSVFAHCIDHARELGRMWFNFGTCNEDAGWTLNDSLLRYKASFGAGSVVQEHFTIPLR